MNGMNRTLAKPSSDLWEEVIGEKNEHENRIEKENIT